VRIRTSSLRADIPQSSIREPIKANSNRIERYVGYSTKARDRATILVWLWGITVTKKTKLSNGDLAATLHARLKETAGCPLSVSFAVVPSKVHGWFAILSPAQRKRNPIFARRFDRLVAQLRQEYDLAKD
jgi:hypothetical protein